MRYIILKQEGDKVEVAETQLIPREWIERYCFLNNLSLRSPIETMLKKWDKENEAERNYRI